MNTNTINQMDLAIKPREKLEEKGVKALSDKECNDLNGQGK